MSTRLHVVAQKDFEDAIRSRMLWSLMGLLVLIVGLVYFAAWWTGQDPAADGLAAIVAMMMQLLVPLTALIAGYMAVVGERQSGSIKILLGFPPSRRDVVFGKLIGRAGVVATAIVAAFVGAIALSLLMFQKAPFGDFAGLAAASVLCGLAFVGIAVGISSAVASRGRAMAGVIGLYLLFLVLWDALAAGAHRAVEGSLPSQPPFDGWYLLLHWLNPLEAFGVLSNHFLESQMGTLKVSIFQPYNAADVEYNLAGEVPFYLQEWFAAVILLAWFAVPVVLGYLRFRSVDLG